MPTCCSLSAVTTPKLGSAPLVKHKTLYPRGSRANCAAVLTALPYTAGRHPKGAEGRRAAATAEGDTPRCVPVGAARPMATSFEDDGCLNMEDPRAQAIAACLCAMLECHQREARLFDTPEWLITFAEKQQVIQRWTVSDLDHRGLPPAHHVLHEICVVSAATSTSRTVQILALGLLNRVLCAGAQASPATRLAHDNWSLLWLFAVHFAAKMHYDVRILAHQMHARSDSDLGAPLGRRPCPIVLAARARAVSRASALTPLARPSPARSAASRSNAANSSTSPTTAASPRT